MVILLGNIPIQILAYRMLGGWRVIAATVYAVVLYSLLIDLLPPFAPISDDRFLNAVFGGIIGGIGTGWCCAPAGRWAALRRWGASCSSATARR